MLNKKTVEDIDVNGKRVLVRCDFNVPLDSKDPNVITSDKRIIASLQTIRYLMEHNAKVILCSHLGKTGQDKSLAPVAKRLSEVLGKEVPLVHNILSNETKELVNNMKPQDVILLENTRMYKEEEANNLDFAQALASLAEIFVNDAFGTAHRAHASTEGVTHFLPSVCGFLIEKELQELGKCIDHPKRPMVAVVGGSKVSSKIDMLESFLDRVDTLLVGGGMVFTFYQALGYPIGNSLVEEDKIEVAKEILEKAEKSQANMLLPIDIVAASAYAEDADVVTVEKDQIPEGYMGLDIGPKTTEEYASIISKAGTVVWNGPMGVFEMDRFAVGTNAIAKAMAECEGVTIVGGGDSASAAKKSGYADRMTHISTGGGASLKLMEGKKLVAIEALDDKDEVEEK